MLALNFPGWHDLHGSSSFPLICSPGGHPNVGTGVGASDEGAGVVGADDGASVVGAGDVVGAADGDVVGAADGA